MADKSKINWCTASLNPLGWGCYGPGGTPEAPKICKGCYAYTQSKGPYPRCPKCAEFKPHWHPEDLEKARKWKKPREIFWQSMGDLWHNTTPALRIIEIMKACTETPQHTHLFLTKSPDRYKEFSHALPKENAYYGATVRDQDEADLYVPELMKLAALGFKTYISYEPAWGPADLSVPFGQGVGDLMIENLSAVIAGGMNGRGKEVTPSHPDWFRGLRDQCKAAGVPFFFKGWGAWQPHAVQEGMFGAGATWHEGKLYVPVGKYNREAKELDNKTVMIHVGNAHHNQGFWKTDRLLDGQEHNDLPWRRQV